MYAAISIFARWSLSAHIFRFSPLSFSQPLQDGCEFEDGTTGACPMKETVDEKAQEDGLGVETVTLAIACDHLVAIGCGENNGVCLMYDVTDIENPSLLKTFHLSPASETKNPEQSYRKDLGDLDAETTLFVPAQHSPTGKAGMLFGGAISGTLSFYEFVCQAEEVTFGSSNNSSNNDGLSGGAIAGIVVGGLAIVLIAGFAIMKKGGGNQKAPTPPPESAAGEDGGVL